MNEKEWSFNSVIISEIAYFLWHDKITAQELHVGEERVQRRLQGMSFEFKSGGGALP